MARIQLVHWNEKEAAELIARLRAAGHLVRYQPNADSSTLRELRGAPPDAVVVDLSRLPSHGREFAVALRGSKATRSVPIVFHGGEAAKVEAIHALLPDAVYADGKGLAAALKRAIQNPPVAPAVPKQMMDRYAGRSAAQKLGIREGMTVALLDAPRDYERVLGAMPARVNFAESEGAVTLWFVHDAGEYRANVAGMRETAARSKLWILWRKGRASLNENLIRETALDFGLVDYKICSVDAVWSGLAFAKGREA